MKYVKDNVSLVHWIDLFRFYTEDLGGADVHTSKSGVADHFAENEPQVGRN